MIFIFSEVFILCVFVLFWIIISLDLYRNLLRTRIKSMNEGISLIREYKDNMTLEDAIKLLEMDEKRNRIILEQTDRVIWLPWTDTGYDKEDEYD